jgi:hypothetical protein
MIFEFNIPTMRNEYDFSQGKRGPVIPPDPKLMRITLSLESDIINYFKEQVHKTGVPITNI